jgi:hypothetical protein
VGDFSEERQLLDHILEPYENYYITDFFWCESAGKHALLKLFEMRWGMYLL